jgi:alpha-tubulin suppressor-like RCC1 family protein
MATFYNFTQGGRVNSFEDTFVQKNVVEDGELFSCGDNNYGGLGTNNTQDRSTPVQEYTSSTNWIHCSAQGYNGSYAIKSDGTLWAWGENVEGNIGDNSQNVHRSTPRQISIASLGGLTGWKLVQGAGSYGAIAIRNDGSLWRWGWVFTGDNTGTTRRSTPRQVSIAEPGGLFGWKEISTNVSFSSAIRTDGTLWVWGDNAYGKIGDNTSDGGVLGTNGRSTPRQISAGATRITGWKKVSCGLHHMAALREDGTLWAWGRNHVGQLGNNQVGVNSFTPVQEFSASNNWKEVDCGRYNTFAIKEDGSLWCWGYNGFGQLGVNDTTDRPTPTTVWNNTKDWQTISSGDYATVAIKTNGELWTWGSNNNPANSGNAGNGVLGTNDRVQRNTPVQTVMGGNNWKQASIGWGSMVAIRYVDSRI